jgi:hypothetical protein
MPGIGTGEDRKRFGRAKKIGDCLVRLRLHRLAQQGDPPIGMDTSACGLEITRQDVEQSRLPNAVAADNSSSLAPKAEIEVIEYGAPVWRRPAEVGNSNGWHRKYTSDKSTDPYL